MKFFSTALLALALMTGSAFAYWPLKDMNKHIEDTNWIVEDRCSGTTVNAALKIILTNWHCISTPGNGGQNINSTHFFVKQVKYQNFSIVKSISYATTVGFISPSVDLAILHIEDEDVTLTTEAVFEKDDTLLRGAKVYLVGNPEMQDGSLVVGSISAPARLVTIDKVSRPYFQVSGGITGGFSGGSVYNENGKLIGVTSAVSHRSNFIGFAVPGEIIKGFLTLAKVPFKASN
jgi:hypothetical protein